MNYGCYYGFRAIILHTFRVKVAAQGVGFEGLGFRGLGFERIRVWCGVRI